jgi:DMSO reductase family type II enzyme heme b subunit
MKKQTVILIAIISLTAFGVTLYYGFRHSRGVPSRVELPQDVVLHVPFVESHVDLQKAPTPDSWSSVPSQELDMIYQITVLPWPRKLVPSVEVKAFHNRKDIYFHIQWRDSTEDRTHGSGRFSDACAIMFPLEKDAKPSTLMMGFLGRSNIWQWKASQDKEFWSKQPDEHDDVADFHYPFEEEETLPVSRPGLQSAVNDLVTVRVGTLTPKVHQGIEGRGFWADGSWQVVFKRPLPAVDQEVDPVFVSDTTMVCAFAVWDGATGDRGGRKSISGLIDLRVAGIEGSSE